jgi:membrane associated rhomboid family serine protease
MKLAYKNKPSYSRPGYSENAVLQLLVAFGIAYVAYNFSQAIMWAAGGKNGNVQAIDANFHKIFTDNLALPAVKNYLSKAWTVLTYGWFHRGFWELFTNMIWLYCFGSIIQMLTSYKQVIPLFVYCLICGGIFYQLSQFLPGDAFIARGPMLGAQAGIIGLAAAALTFSPGYRFYFTEHFSVPLVVVVVVYTVLAVMNTGLHGTQLMLLGGGALAGFGYVKLLQNGYMPGAWPYHFFDRLSNMANPDEKALRAKNNVRRNEIISRVQSNKNITQKKIDDILDKINTQGYHSLNKEEKETLLKAGKDNHNS